MSAVSTVVPTASCASRVPEIRRSLAGRGVVHRTGRLRDAGGFTDDSGGAAIFEATDDAAAEAFVKTDPAVTSGTFAYELKRWRPNPWAEISKARAAKGK